MKLLNNASIEEYQIATRHKRIINKLFPISINRSKTINSIFSITFIAYEDYSENYNFYTVLLSIEDENDTINAYDADYLEMQSQYLKDLIPMEYKEILEEVERGERPFDSFILDLSFDTEYKSYFCTNAIKQLSRTHYAYVDVFVPGSMFIRLELMINYLLDRVPFHSIFLSPIFDIVDFNTVEYISITSTKYPKDNDYENHNSMIESNYCAGVGPTTFMFNYIVPVPPNYEDIKLGLTLKNPLIFSKFDIDNEKYVDIYPGYIILHKNIAYVVIPYCKGKYISKDRLIERTTVLKINLNVHTKTNLVDIYNNIFENYDQGENK